MITLQELRLISESYTSEPWGGKALNASFSRLYYILDGEAYYEEMGKRVRLQKNHLYLTPVKKNFGLEDNPADQLLHTYAHITTLPAITRFTEIPVIEGTPLFDAVALWRRHVHSKDKATLCAILQLVLSCIGPYLDTTAQTPEERIREQLHLCGGEIDMQKLSRHLGYSREHLIRVFKAAYHTTPHRYCETLRMERATELLLSGMPVYRVAQELHYSSPYAFSKAFKKHFGVAPRPYVKSFSQANGT